MSQAAPVLVQSTPLVHSALGQDGGDTHALAPSQVVSHAHDPEQSMPLAQLNRPPQLTWQRPAPQITSPAHDSRREHSMSHSLAALQSTPARHDSMPLHMTWHGMPAGQVTPSEQAPDPEQSMRQVP